jgi:hypothetical protein
MSNAESRPTTVAVVDCPLGSVTVRSSPAFTVWFAVTSRPGRQRMPLDGTRGRPFTAKTARPACCTAVAS